MSVGGPLWLALALLPALLVGGLVLRGYAPWPLVRAFLWRFRWVSGLFALLIAASIGLSIALMAGERGLRMGTAKAADKFDLIIAAPGSEMTMLMASVYLQPSAVPLIGGEIYEAIASHPQVRLAAPIAFGDSFHGAPVVGTTADFVRHLAGGEVEGRLFEAELEAVAGALAPVGIGESFEPAHGHGDHADEDAHDLTITVVGRLPPSGTPWDRAILVPLEQVWETHGLGNGHAARDQLGQPYDPVLFPGTPAVIVQSRDLPAAYALRAEFTNAQSMAFFPGAVQAELYRVMGDIRQLMSLMSLVTQGLVAASVLVGLVILIRLVRRQLALLRALGAPRRFVFAVVWSFGTALLVSGAVGGLVLGQGAAWLLSNLITARTDIVIRAPLSWPELHLVAGFVSLSSLIALLPAWTVLRQPIVSALRA